MKPRQRALMAAPLLFALSCQADRPAPVGEDGSDSVRTFLAPDTTVRIFERNLVFMDSHDDSSLIVPWFFNTRVQGDSVERSVSGSLHRRGEWETFLADRWTDRPTRAPWRLMPHGALSLMVDEVGIVTRLVYDDGPRQLELAFGERLIAWNAAAGSTIELLEGDLLLSSEPVNGLVLDVSRSGDNDRVDGDWAFLVSGDSLQVVLKEARPTQSDTTRYHRGWARLDFRDLRWPQLRTEWKDVRAFEAARREVPVSWRFSGDSGGVLIEVQASDSHLTAGDGSGAQLPVDALFAVVGTVSIGDVEYPVRGFLRHVQP